MAGQRQRKPKISVSGVGETVAYAAQQHQQRFNSALALRAPRFAPACGARRPSRSSRRDGHQRQHRGGRGESPFGTSSSASVSILNSASLLARRQRLSSYGRRLRRSWLDFCLVGHGDAQRRAGEVGSATGIASRDSPCLCTASAKHRRNIMRCLWRKITRFVGWQQRRRGIGGACAGQTNEELSNGRWLCVYFSISARGDWDRRAYFPT